MVECCTVFTAIMHNFEYARWGQNFIQIDGDSLCSEGQDIDYITVNAIEYL